MNPFELASVIFNALIFALSLVDPAAEMIRRGLAAPSAQHAPDPIERADPLPIDEDW